MVDQLVSVCSVENIINKDVGNIELSLFLINKLF
jgi:hypothetical protein